LFHPSVSGSEDGNARKRESEREPLERDLYGIGPSSEHLRQQDSTNDVGVTADLLSLRSTSFEEDADDNLHKRYPKQTGNKRYSKHDVMQRSSEDTPMLDKECTRDCVPKDTRTCAARLKQVREIGTQTSVLTVNESDNGRLTR